MRWEGLGGKSWHTEVGGQAVARWARWATHPVLSVGVHHAGLDHIQGLAQERGTYALQRVSQVRRPCCQQLLWSLERLRATLGPDLRPGASWSHCARPCSTEPRGAALAAPA